MSEDLETQAFWDHALELQRCLRHMLASILCFALIALYFYPQIFTVLTKPLQSNQDKDILRKQIQIERVYNPQSSAKVISLSKGQTLRAQQDLGDSQILPNGRLLIAANSELELETTRPINELFILSPAEGMLVTFKVCFWLGLILSSPFWLLRFFLFLSPGLYQREKGLVFPFLALSLIFFSLGAAFAYFFTLPIANHFLTSFNEKIGINLWSLENYLDYTVLLLLSSGLAFEALVFLFFAIHYGLVNERLLRKIRRPVILGVFIASALLTPPDVLTQCLLAVPMLILYELAILYASFSWKKESIELAS